MRTRVKGVCRFCCSVDGLVDGYVPWGQREEVPGVYCVDCQRPQSGEEHKYTLKRSYEVQESYESKGQLKLLNGMDEPVDRGRGRRFAYPRNKRRR